MLNERFKNKKKYEDLYIYTPARALTHAHTDTRIRAHEYTHARTGIHTHAHTNLRTRRNMKIYIYIYPRARPYTRAHGYTHTRTRIHTRAHKNTHTRLSGRLPARLPDGLPARPSTCPFICFMHFYSGTRTFHAESINSYLQCGLKQTFRTHTTLNTEQNQLAIKLLADNQCYRNACG